MLGVVALFCLAGAEASAAEAPAAEGWPASFHFTYGDVRYEGVTALTPLKTKTKRKGVAVETESTYRLDDTMTVRICSTLFVDFGSREYTVWFENTGTAPSKELKDVVCLEADFDGREPVLRGIMGDHGFEYSPYEKNLTQEKVDFATWVGQPTHGVFPYFDLVHGDGGTLLALGWGGSWNAHFSGDAEKAHVKAVSNPDLDAVLLPGEKVRTALVVQLPYSGRDADAAMNLWRRWYLAHVLPKADGRGTPMKPIATACFAGDTGLPNMDGSVSERYFTWRRSLDVLRHENIKLDFRWVDAGWYCDGYKQTNLVDWHGVGTWELDSAKWPGHSFRESVMEYRKAGMRTFLWFEVERNTNVDGLVKNFGYKEEWSACGLNNLGNPECYEWTKNRIFKIFDETDIDMYREDFNIDPLHGWREFDKRRQQAKGIPSGGISENFGVQGHYALWDAIIAYMRKRGKCPFVDSCASGGGRNDLESMRRGFPIMRSDVDRMEVSRRLSQTSSLCRWLPYHGTFYKETPKALDTSTGAGPDNYVFRASLLPVCNLWEAFTHNPDFDYELLRRNLAEWRRLAPMTLKDFHVLTPWHAPLDDAGWTVFAWNDPESGDMILLAFRQAACKEPETTVAMNFVDAADVFECESLDEPGSLREIKGSDLRNGLALKLDAPRSCLVWHFRRLQKGAGK